MTASRKSIIILFFALVAGFFVGFIILYNLFGVVTGTHSGEALDIISQFTRLIWIFCYPPLAISTLFYRQVGNAFSRWGIIMSLLIVLGLLFAMIFEFQGQLFKQSYDGMIYLFIPALIAAVLSCFVIGFACINQKQKKMTLLFGYSTLIDFVIACIYSFIAIALAFFMGVVTAYISFGLGFGLMVWFVGLSALSAVFHGLKDDEQSA